eukprot:CAMPEP_0119056444 /NCGR_PEP_ID=MMETSP1178-20130426/1098_1 /TAXON_ID=33656 /ORGANISM="unid sp, Strain CCMP2000" /LENGTH=252 /DNA_ID=CAMNT_0007037173 /DNA_START=98 /DNA_END=853 /DNA_ORIENTATION=+
MTPAGATLTGLPSRLRGTVADRSLPAAKGQEPLRVRLCLASLGLASFETVTPPPPKTGAVVLPPKTGGVVLFPRRAMETAIGEAAGGAGGAAAVRAAAGAHSWTSCKAGVRPDGVDSEEAGPPRAGLDLSLVSQKGLDLTESFLGAEPDAETARVLPVSASGSADAGAASSSSASIYVLAGDDISGRRSATTPRLRHGAGYGFPRALLELRSELPRLRVTRSDEPLERSAGGSHDGLVRSVGGSLVVVIKFS